MGWQPAPVCALSQVMVPPGTRRRRVRGPRQKGPHTVSPERRGSGRVLEAPALGGMWPAPPCRRRLVRKPSNGANRAVNPSEANIPETRCETGMNPDPTTASKEAETGHAQTHMRSRSTHACTFPGGSVSAATSSRVHPGPTGRPPHRTPPTRKQTSVGFFLDPQNQVVRVIWQTCVPS